MKKMLVILFFQVALVESLREVSGYLGDTVILPSGVDPSWNLSSIEWSIFLNNTWIATHRNRRTNIERVDRYKGRLGLNISSGDLMIRNLTIEDDMEYTVYLINTERQNSRNKTKLIVRQHLHTPTIQTSVSVEGGCIMWLLCSSMDKDVDLSWQVKSPGVTVFHKTYTDGNSAVLVAFLNTTQDSAEVSCTSSRNMEKASSVVTLKCDDNKIQPEPIRLCVEIRGRWGLVYVGAILICLIIMTCFFRCKRHMNQRN